MFDVTVVGGFGHVGLPLAISLANKGKNVCALDINKKTGNLILQGKMPFLEEGAEQVLKKVIKDESLKLSLDPEVIAESDVVILIIGTPVDRHLNPDFEQLREVIENYMEYFCDGQLVILRSTVYPGTTGKLYRWFIERGKKVDMAFCPERIAEGYAMRELEELPQIVSSFSDSGIKRSTELFRLLTKDILVLEPIEAELTKLFTNVWRYIKFATANQFYMIANDHGADFYNIHHGMTYKYKRAQDFPKPGFAAGPCLFKDAMQLAAFNNNTFYLGHSAMLVNEGLPNYIVNKLKQKYNLWELTVGILGMAYKPDIDDRRESLSYKLKKIFEFECRQVLCSDIYICEKGFVSTDELINQSDVVILATPHKEYLELCPDDSKIIVDIWNVWGGRGRI